MARINLGQQKSGPVLQSMNTKSQYLMVWTARLIDFLEAVLFAIMTCTSQHGERFCRFLPVLESRFGCALIWTVQGMPLFALLVRSPRSFSNSLNAAGRCLPRLKEYSFRRTFGLHSSNGRYYHMHVINHRFYEGGSCPIPMPAVGRHQSEVSEPFNIADSIMAYPTATTNIYINYAAATSYECLLLPLIAYAVIQHYREERALFPAGLNEMKDVRTILLDEVQTVAGPYSMSLPTQLCH